MFKQGDLVFHSVRGAGIIKSIQHLKVAGGDEPYYNISLATGETLLVPAREEQVAVLSTVTALRSILDVLYATPEVMADDHRLRTLNAEDKISSGDPLKVAEALRDLAWRQHTSRLSGGDLRLMSKAHKVLSNALVAKPDLDLLAASKALDGFLKQAALAWDAAV